MAIDSSYGYNIDAGQLSRTIDFSEKGAIKAMFSDASHSASKQDHKSAMSQVRENEGLKAGNQVRNVDGLKQKGVSHAKSANIQVAATKQEVQNDIGADQKSAEKAHGQAMDVAKKVSDDPSIVQDSYAGGDPAAGLMVQVASAALTKGVSSLATNVAELAHGIKKGSNKLSPGAKAKLEQKVAAVVSTNAASTASPAQIARNVGADGADNVKSDVSALGGVDKEGIKEALENTLQENDKASEEKRSALAALEEVQDHNKAIQNRDDLGGTDGNDDSSKSGGETSNSNEYIVTAIAVDLNENAFGALTDINNVKFKVSIKDEDFKKLEEEANADQNLEVAAAQQAQAFNPNAGVSA